MTGKKTHPHCPICRAEVALLDQNKAFPFCSERCKSEDLGKWFGGSYLVPGRAASPEEIVEEVRRPRQND
ncbi:DNA gyrase inhibitor YacG [Bradymonadaceae bacterium TMQ3]|uniref:DNA gyrase inhibitor YacG n=1 Tax=Lujinxingia sediminis TaxID=2480984 RepID=A0ABY0CQU7_9DELT|nr:DNA gyrase inhibitor YacG [Lujinxingia sediminis]RDV37023.1 DNA gyrase inhibitor YacG [Bradymonadaceae bacterium TMQ3]RVU42895.1 DNA gyrase inhibitor YacG [Lujinxingia sediminis]TXC73148.1 DNA gyrase inhibitor YacG [Bradymonadales bacterium TMQ1]